MPDKTGVGIYQAIRRSGGALAKVPILVLTGLRRDGCLCRKIGRRQQSFEENRMTLKYLTESIHRAPPGSRHRKPAPK